MLLLIRLDTCFGIILQDYTNLYILSVLFGTDIINEIIQELTFSVYKGVTDNFEEEKELCVC